MHFDCVDVNLLSTIISQMWHFLLVEIKNITKLTNEHDIKFPRSLPIMFDYWA